MDTLDILIKAIQLQKSISYEYNAPGRAIGVRFGNPHAIFVSTTENVNIDIFKIDGVKTDPSKPIPAWRQYKVKHMENVSILVDDNEFEIAVGYNPTSKQYANVIAKV
jgi:hypothetical protein